MHYTQCRLRAGSFVHTAWIPSTLAIVNKKIIIDSMEGFIWTVEEKYETKSGDLVEVKARDYLRQREASDI